MAAPVRSALILLFSGAALLLLVTCGNAAALSLTNAVARQHEWAIRVALGASPIRIASETAAQTVLLAIAGCAWGLGSTWGLVRWFAMHHPERFPRLDAVRVDLPVVAFAILAAFGAAVLTAVAPAVRAVRTDPSDALKETRAGRASHRSHRLLVALQVAMAVTLLITTVGLARQLSSALSADIGSTRDVLTARLDLTGASFRRPDAQRIFLQRLLDDLSTGGQIRAGLLSSLPPATGQMRTTIPATGGEASAPEILVDIVAATPNAIEILGVPLRRGRSLSDADTADSPAVAVLSDTAARRLFPGRDAIGMRVPFGSSQSSQPLVVGVVGDVRYRGLDSAPEPAMYLPASQRSFRTMYVVTSGGGNRDEVAQRLQASVRRTAPSIAIAGVKALTTLRQEAAAGSAFRTTIIGTLSGAALLLACVGVYGVTARSARLRRREFAVRMALGGRGTQVVRLMAADTAWLCAWGGLSGVLLALVAQQLARRYVLGFPTLDAVTAGTAVAFAVLLGVCVALIPTWRATSIPPSSVLRS